MFKKPSKKLHIILISSTIIMIFLSSFNLVSAQTVNVNEKPIRLALVVWAPNFLAFIA